ncbi:MAG TPA: hypothetical protein VFI73_11255 [Candidatus Nitrosopolaris sp.]|nr:hypothetical protein [Candidatus Nitrosopolaris sp.]
MIVKSADPTTLNGASLAKMLNEIEALVVNGYTLKSITECNGEIFAFLLNEAELKKVEKKTRRAKKRQDESV